VYLNEIRVYYVFSSAFLQGIFKCSVATCGIILGIAELQVYNLRNFWHRGIVRSTFLTDYGMTDNGQLFVVLNYRFSHSTCFVKPHSKIQLFSRLTCHVDSTSQSFLWKIDFLGQF
jgi:hypothetical protein